MDIHVTVFSGIPVFSPSGYLPRSGIAESCSNSMFNPLGNFSLPFKSLARMMTELDKLLALRCHIVAAIVIVSLTKLSNTPPQSHPPQQPIPDSF